MAVRIFVADDHEVVRQGLKRLIGERSDWVLCGEAADGRAALRAVLELKPDVVIMDVAMSRLNGLLATRQITKALPKTHVLVLTMYDSEQVALEAVRMGARGWVPKTDAAQTLVRAIETVLANRTYFPAEVEAAVLDAYRTGRGRRTNGGVTVRQREIVQLLAEGLSNKEVASTLGISVKTAETHRANIMRRLNLKSLGELVRYAVREKIAKL